MGGVRGPPLESRWCGGLVERVLSGLRDWLVGCDLPSSLTPLRDGCFFRCGLPAGGVRGPLLEARCNDGLPEFLFAGLCERILRELSPTGLHFLVKLRDRDRARELLK